MAEETGFEMDDRSRPRRASEWLVDLLEAPDDAALRAGFSRWLDADPDHARDWAEIARTYQAMGLALPAHRARWGAAAADGAGPRPLPDIDRPAPSRPPPAPAPSHLRRYVLGLVGAALAACLGMLLLPGVVARWGADHATGAGETRRIALADGSSVRLAPQSAIAVAYSAGERRIRLIAGAAYFEVAVNPVRPFRVGANVVEATVLGTAFEVRLEADATGVAVRQGRVRVRNDAAAPPVAAILEAGDWARLAWNGAHAGGHLRPDDVAAWQDGLLVAQDRPVAAVVDELRPYFRGFVVLRGAALARQPLTGVYNLADPVAALRAIAETQGATLHRLSPWLIVLSGG